MPETCKGRKHLSALLEEGIYNSNGFKPDNSQDKAGAIEEFLQRLGFPQPPCVGICDSQEKDCRPTALHQVEGADLSVQDDAKEREFKYYRLRVPSSNILKAEVALKTDCACIKHG